MCWWRFRVVIHFFKHSKRPFFSVLKYSKTSLNQGASMKIKIEINGVGEKSCLLAEFSPFSSSWRISTPSPRTKEGRWSWNSVWREQGRSDGELCVPKDTDWSVQYVCAAYHCLSHRASFCTKVGKLDETAFGVKLESRIDNRTDQLVFHDTHCSPWKGPFFTPNTVSSHLPCLVLFINFYDSIILKRDDLFFCFPFSTKPKTIG